MSTMIQGDQMRALLLGVRVQKSIAITGISTKSLFTVTGGKVLLTSIFGEVTTVVQAQANAAKLTFNPDGAGATSDLCGTLDINGGAVGVYYSITGTAATAMGSGVQSVPSNLGLATPFMLSAGVIGLSTAASSTGAILWTATYIPYDNGAAMVAA